MRKDHENKLNINLINTAKKKHNMYGFESRKVILLESYFNFLLVCLIFIVFHIQLLCLMLRDDPPLSGFHFF